MGAMESDRERSECDEERAEANESDLERVLTKMDVIAPLNATSRA